MPASLDDAALDRLFRTARTANAFRAEPVPEATLRALYELLKWGPTAANAAPARFVFVTSPAAREKLRPALSEGNAAKTMAAPVTVIVGFDEDFHEKLPFLFPHGDAKSWFDGPREGRHEAALRNGSLQGAYLILAARAGPGCRADVRFRQRGGGCGLLRRHCRQVQLPRQSRLCRSGRHLPAPAPAGLRRGRRIE
jgi:3-hydroxypropanoate dehydrogenase